MTTEATCAERWADHKNSRLAHISSLFDIIDHPSRVAPWGSDPEDVTSDLHELAAECDIEHEDRSPDDLAEDAQTQLYQLPLCVDVRAEITVVLSTGGPGDELVFVCDADDGYVRSASYRFLDWWDGETRTLSGTDRDIACRFLDELCAGDVAYFLKSRTGAEE
jgi:hypothetical protein